MAKYSISNNLRFLEFIELSTGNVTAFNKESINEVWLTETDPYLFLLLEGDVGEHRFRYDEVVDPTTGLPFTSNDVFKTFIVDSLNDSGAITSVPLGSWNALTNTPVLGDGAMYDSDNSGTVDLQAVANQYFVVSTAGSTTIDGNGVWEVGDYVRSTGTQWIRVESADTISAAKVIYQATTVDDALTDIYSKLSLSELDDTDVVGVQDGDALVFDGTSGKWVPGESSGGGRTMYPLIGFVEGDATAPTTDGLYILDSTASAGWIPSGAEIGDILKLESAVWTIEVVAADKVGGSIESWFENPTGYKVNFVWDGTGWSSYNAYVPSPVLDDIQLENPIGELAGYTGKQLKYKSVSWVFDNMFFTTVYVKPIAPTLSISSSTGNFERGYNISGTRTITFTQNGAGAVTEATIEAYENDVLQETLVSATVPASINLNNINGHDLVIPGIVNQTAKAKVTVDYSAGPIPTDNKGVEYPGDQILAGSLEQTATFTARYPIWYGRTPERFTIATGDESVELPLIAPNDGSNSGGVLLNETWIRANLTQQLFTSNLSNKVATIQSGDVHCLVICPPGISVTQAQIFAAGAWVNWSDLTTYSFDIVINDAVGGNPRTYKAHYVRSVAGDSFAAIQDFRFSTSGSIIP